MARSNSYDLILMDLQMPVLGGLDAARIIRNDLKMQLPIIALTAATLKEDQEASLASGMNDFHTKPIRVEKLKKLFSNRRVQTFRTRRMGPRCLCS